MLSFEEMAASKKKNNSNFLHNFDYELPIKKNFLSVMYYKILFRSPWKNFESNLSAVPRKSESPTWKT